jgi:hypothetical protein
MLGGVPVAESEAARMINEKVEAQQPAALGKDWTITHPIGTTRGRPRHDLWTKLRTTMRLC